MIRDMKEEFCCRGEKLHLQDSGKYCSSGAWREAELENEPPKSFTTPLVQVGLGGFIWNSGFIWAFWKGFSHFPVIRTFMF